MSIRTVVVASILFAAPWSADGAELSKTAEKLAQERLEAARDTFIVTWSNYREHRAQADTVYRWSIRWLEAEKFLADGPDALIAAHQKHADRMRALERIVEAVFRVRQATVDEMSGAEFYRSEAELWLLLAKEAKAAAAKKDK